MAVKFSEEFHKSMLETLSGGNKATLTVDVDVPEGKQVGDAIRVIISVKARADGSLDIVHTWD